MNLLETAAFWLKNRMAESLSVSVVHVRGDGSEIAVRAVLGRTLFRAESEYGQTIRTTSVDFLVPAEYMPLEPRRGEKMIYNGGVYEILAPNGEPVWRWADDYRAVRRIHTKYIGERNG